MKRSVLPYLAAVVSLTALLAGCRTGHETSALDGARCGLKGLMRVRLSVEPIELPVRLNYLPEHSRYAVPTAAEARTKVVAYLSRHLGQLALDGDAGDPVLRVRVQHVREPMPRGAARGAGVYGQCLLRVECPATVDGRSGTLVLHEQTLIGLARPHHPHGPPDWPPGPLLVDFVRAWRQANGLPVGPAPQDPLDPFNPRREWSDTGWPTNP